MHRRKQMSAQVFRRALDLKPKEEIRDSDRGVTREAPRIPDEELEGPMEGPRASQAPVRERSAPVVLAEAQKEDIVEWIQANECLYNKGHPKYKDSAHKFQLWLAKATELGITQKTLTTWWHNQRTKYGRLTRSVGPSESGRKEDSEEDKWCRRSFQFLGRFVSRTHSRRGVDLDARMRQRYSEGGDEVSTTATGTAATGTATQSKKRKRSEESPYVQELQEAINRCAELQAQITTQMTGGFDSCSREKHQWGAWMSSSMQHIHDSLWPSFMQDSMHLMTDYKARSEALRKRSTQQQVP